MRNCKVKIISLSNLLEKILIINAVFIKGVLHMYYKKRPHCKCRGLSKLKITTTSSSPAAKSCIFKLTSKKEEELINEESTVSALRFRNTPRASLPESATKQEKKKTNPKPTYLERHKLTTHCSQAPNTRNTTLISASRSASLQLRRSSKLRHNYMTKMHPISAAFESEDCLPPYCSTTNPNKE